MNNKYPHVIPVLIIIAVVMEFSIIALNRIMPQKYDSGEYDYDIGEYFPEADASERGGITFLSDDDVREAGVSCTELGHFDLQAAALSYDLYDIFNDEGLKVREMDTSSYNQAYGDGGSWYETLMTFYLDIPGDDTGYQRLTVNYDTATGQLHEIDLFLTDKERILSLAEAIMDLLGAYTPDFDDEIKGDATGALSVSIQRGENLYAVYGDLAVTLYCFEDGYSIYIGRE